MKTEETIFLLTNESNYYVKVKSMYSDVVKSFCNLVNFYVSYSIENMNIKDKDIFYTGLNVVQHIFRIMFLYTKNLELSFYNTQQSIYYFVEYISQITDNNDNIFFNLSIKDAVIYVYTRTIFEIRKQYIKKNCPEDVQIFHQLKNLTNNYVKIVRESSQHFFDLPLKETKDNLNKLYDKFVLVDFHNVNILDDVNTSSWKEILHDLEKKSTIDKMN